MRYCVSERSPFYYLLFQRYVFCGRHLADMCSGGQCAWCCSNNKVTNMKNHSLSSLDNVLTVCCTAFYNKSVKGETDRVT